MAKNCLTIPGFCGGEIASIPHYSNLLAQINDAIAKGQQHRIRSMAARDQVGALKEGWKKRCLILPPSLNSVLVLAPLPPPSRHRPYHRNLPGRLVFPRITRPS